MLSMFFPYILYAKVVDEETKLDGVPFVAPKARSSGRLEVPCLVEALVKDSKNTHPLYAYSSRLYSSINSWGISDNLIFHIFWAVHRCP